MALNVSLSKLPWYGQVGAFAALSLAAVGVFWNWYARPMQATLATRRAELTKLQADITRGRATAARLPQFRREVATLQAQLDQLRAVLPEEQDVADLLRRVQGMATQSNLTIRGFTPRPVARKTLHMEWPIGLELEGRYHDLGAFLERVSKFPRIINISDLQIKAIGKPAGGATITAECTATTFVLIEPASPKPGAPKTPARPAPAAGRATE
jgi:type IV pilus assembly protein PilO